MKTIEEFLKEENEFLQLLIFKGRDECLYGLIVPNLLAETIREKLYDSSKDTNNNFVLEDLLLNNIDYPGAVGENISEVINEITVKIQRTNVRKIYNFLTENKDIVK